MTPAQQQELQRIVTAYREGDDTQRPQWREVASYIYANALRDEDISAIELRTAFQPLERIASSAGFGENAAAVSRALLQPVEDTLTAAKTGRAWAATAMHLLQMQHEPFYPIRQLREGLQSMTTAVEQWAEHATGALSMEERERLATLYELPHAQRLQALHGVALHDTATMIGIGTLPRLLAESVVAADTAIPGTVGSLMPDAQWQWPMPHAQTAKLVLAGTQVTEAPALPQLMAMASPPDGHDHAGKPAETPVIRKEVDPAIPDEILRYRETVMLDHAHAAFSHHLASIRILEGKKKIELYAHENRLIDDYTNYLINPRIVQTEAEYQQVMADTRTLVQHVEKSEWQRTLAEGVDPAEALAQSKMPGQLFEQMVPWLEARHKRHLGDLIVEEAEYAHMQAALQDPDSVGYGRSVSPRSITERELHHADYWGRLWQDAGELAEHLQLLGLDAQADTVVDEIRAMVHIRLDDSKTALAERMANFMAIAQDADKVDINNLSGQGYTARGFEKIRDNIGGELHHLRDEIEQEQEYFIRDQLWRWRHTEENRVKDDARHTAIRNELFGNATLQDEPGHER